MTIYVGQGGVNRAVKEIYVGQGGVNRKVKETYVGQGGVNRKSFTAAEQLTVASVDAGLDQSGWGITAGQYLWLRQQASGYAPDSNKSLHFNPNTYNLAGKSTLSVDWSAIHTGSVTMVYAFVIGSTNVIYYNGYTTVERQTTDISLSGYQGAYHLYMWIARWGTSNPGGGTMYIYSIKLDGVTIFVP